MDKKVYILGGSFNPPHIGHIEICRYVLKKDRGSRIWVVPCLRHPFGKRLAPFEARLTMARMSFFGMKGVFVSDVEKRLGGISHTIRTIRYLKEKHPDWSISLILGSDALLEKERWKEFDEILKLAGVLEIKRGKGSPIPDVSSSEIREMIREGKDASRFLHPRVYSYILSHGLYLE
jgi:nicotinate-nucleotide adenylyltransferase